MESAARHSDRGVHDSPQSDPASISLCDGLAHRAADPDKASSPRKTDAVAAVRCNVRGSVAGSVAERVT